VSAVARAYVSIGSNIEREKNIRAAVAALRRRYGTLQLSPVYQCRPVGFEGDDFLNLVAGFDTDEPPLAVAQTLHDIEQQHGRVRGPSRFSARTLDLDLLLYEDLIRNDRELRLPRDEIATYAFVLRPLAELAPERRHPRTGITLAEMWRGFDAASQPLTRVPMTFDDSDCAPA